MQLINTKDFLANYVKYLDNLPFCFTYAYLNNSDTKFIFEYQQAISLVQISSHRGFKTLKFVFPPITLSADRLTIDEERLFCNAAVNFLKKNKLCDRIAQPENFCLFNACPDKAISIPFGTYYINLQDKSENDLLQQMQARYRTAINQVSKFNPEIKYGIAELENFALLHKETMLRTNSYYEDFKSLKKDMMQMPENILLATIYINNRIEGGLFVKYNNYGAYYIHGASSNTNQAAGAVKYLHYQAMLILKNKSVKKYDFVGARLSENLNSKLKGIQDFKRRFGSELQKGYLWKIDINPSRCKFFDALLFLKCKLKGTSLPIDIIDQERQNLFV